MLLALPAGNCPGCVNLVRDVCKSLWMWEAFKLKLKLERPVGVSHVTEH